MPIGSGAALHESSAPAVRTEFHESAILFQSKVDLAHSRMGPRATSLGGSKSNLTASRTNCAFCSGSVISKWNWSGCIQSSLVFCGVDEYPAVLRFLTHRGEIGGDRDCSRGHGLGERDAVDLGELGWIGEDVCLGDRAGQSRRGSICRAPRRRVASCAAAFLSSIPTSARPMNGWNPTRPSHRPTAPWRLGLAF